MVGYIHLNPLRAGLVKPLIELKSYRYCGHAGIVGAVKNSWHATDGVLMRFDEDLSSAVGKYQNFVFEVDAAGK